MKRLCGRYPGSHSLKPPSQLKQPVAKWLSRQNVLAECLPLRGQLRQSLLLQAKIPDSRLTTTLESNREHLTL